MGIIISKMIDLNTIKNIILFYCHLSAVIACFLVFFGPIFKANFDDFSKKLTFKIFISILLKYIGNNLAIVFVSHNDFQSR